MNKSWNSFGSSCANRSICIPNCLKAGVYCIAFCAKALKRSMAACCTACCTASIFRKTVKIGRAELPSCAPRSREVNASIPFALTSSSAAATISSRVNFGFGGMKHRPFSKSLVSNQLFCII